MKNQVLRTSVEAEHTGTPVIDPKWAWHFRVLSQLRSRLEGERDLRRAEVVEPLAPVGIHAADSATDEFDHDLALALLAHEENALVQINEALERIRRGTYGRCLATGNWIPARRLRVLPWCRYTREVEETIEQAGEDAGKPQLPSLSSLRGPHATIPGTGDLPREGTEHEPKPPQEPKSGNSPDHGPGPGEETADAGPS